MLAHSVVSTHATLRVATAQKCVLIEFKGVSTHATLRVATREISKSALADRVSTHATLRVATIAGLKVPLVSNVSTHATLRVATFTLQLHHTAKKFQLTRPCGSRRQQSSTHVVHRAVSTHATLRVATSSDARTVSPAGVSTHATLRVATGVSLANCLIQSFQLTRPCGSRPVGGRREYRYTMFQLTRPCGSRHVGSFAFPFVFSFNSRDPAGRD